MEVYAYCIDWAWGGSVPPQVTHPIVFMREANADGSLKPRGGLWEPARLSKFISDVHASGRKVSFSVGGGANAEFKTAMADPIARARLVTDITAVYKANGFDGVNLDPEPWSTQADFEALTRAVRAALPDAVLSMASGRTTKDDLSGDITALAPLARETGMYLMPMIYDELGPWWNWTGVDAANREGPGHPAWNDRQLASNERQFRAAEQAGISDLVVGALQTDAVVLRGLLDSRGLPVTQPRQSFASMDSWQMKVEYSTLATSLGANPEDVAVWDEEWGASYYGRVVDGKGEYWSLPTARQFAHAVTMAETYKAAGLFIWKLPVAGGEPLLKALKSHRLQECYGAARDAARQWADGDCALELTAAPLVRDRNGVGCVTVDMQVRRNGELVFDDRVNLVKQPPVYTGDGVFTTEREYEDATVDERARPFFTAWYSDAEYAALTPERQAELTLGRRTRERQGLVYDPELAFRRVLLHTAKVSTQRWTKPHLKRRDDGSFIGDTSTFFAATADDHITSLSFASWAAAQGGGETVFAVQNDGILAPSVQVTADPLYVIDEAFVSFDTSALGDDDTVDSYTFTLTGDGVVEADGHGTTAQARIHDWGAGVTTADWIDGSTATNWTDKTLFADFDVTNWNQADGTDNNFTSQGAEASINKTGTTYLAIAMANMAGAQPATTGSGIETYSADATGTTNDPTLVVNHTPPAPAFVPRLALMGVE